MLDESLLNCIIIIIIIIINNLKLKGKLICNNFNNWEIFFQQKYQPVPSPRFSNRMLYLFSLSYVIVKWIFLSFRLLFEDTKKITLGLRVIGLVSHILRFQGLLALNILSLHKK